MLLATLLTSFETSDHLTLPGFMFSPKKKTKKVLLYLHGNGYTGVFRNIERLQIYSDALAANNVAFFPFDNRGAYLVNKFNYIDENGKKQLKKAGSSYELIQECIFDIDGAIAYLETLGYTTFYLAGHSTGANKIIVYNHYKKNNKISKYVLLGGGDDTGIYFETLGPQLFNELLQLSNEKCIHHQGGELIPLEKLSGQILSFQSFYDLCNPDGDYNSFPYREYFNNYQLSQKQLLFYQFSQVTIPTLMIYGERDIYAWPKMNNMKKVLLQKAHKDLDLTFFSIPSADHNFTGNLKKVIQAVISWI